DALAFTGQQQTSAIGFQGYGSISVPCGSRQAVQIGRKALLLHAWRRRRGAHAYKLSVQEGKSAPQKNKVCAHL
ncbi:MAG: hypothetical protein WA581_17155, partial [Candidatus Acidiferrales bacterium]